MGQLTVYEAISEMRKRSAQGQEISFSFMSYSETKQKTEGIVEVRRARLRPRSQETDFLNGDLLEPYTDMDTLEQRRFNIPTLMTFNGQKTTLL